MRSRNEEVTFSNTVLSHRRSRIELGMSWEVRDKAPVTDADDAKLVMRRAKQERGGDLQQHGAEPQTKSDEVYEDRKVSREVLLSTREKRGRCGDRDNECGAGTRR